MQKVFAIHGANSRSKQDFDALVSHLETRLGRDWEVEGVWWGSAGVDVDLARQGLPYCYSAAPGIIDGTSGSGSMDVDLGPTIGEAESEQTGTEFIPPGVAFVLWHGRRLMLQNFAGIAADVFLYWHQRDQIRQRVLELLPSDGTPVNIVAHSLGGIIALDLALEGSISISGLVTFGSQPAAIHVLDPTRNAIPAFRPGARIRVPRIGRWENLWNRWDPLAFLAGGVFELANGPVRDVEVSLPRSTPIGRVHSAYWSSPQLPDAVRSACAQ